MICSRCHARNIPGDAVVCPNCGGTLVSDEAPQPPMPEELERALKRDLGGQFQINELLGRGGMSLVYRDRDGHTVVYVIASGPIVPIPERGRVQIERWRPLLRKESDGFSLIVWRQAGLVCVMASDLVSEGDVGRFKQYFAKVRASTELSKRY